MNSSTHAKDTDQRKIPTAFRWIDKQSKAWDLSRDELSDLLGGMPRATLSKYIKQAKCDQQIVINRDLRERLSLLLGIHQALRILFPEGKADEAFNRPFSARPLYGNSIRQYLLSDGSMNGLYTVRRWLDGQRG